MVIVIKHLFTRNRTSFPL